MTAANGVSGSDQKRNRRDVGAVFCRAKRVIAEAITATTRYFTAPSLRPAPVVSVTTPSGFAIG